MSALGDDVTREYASLKDSLLSVRERTKEVEAIDAQYRLERIGRAQALAAELDTAFYGHISKIEAYLFQLEEGGSFPLSPTERQILVRVCSNWRELLRQAKEENTSTAAALERLVTLIGTERADAP
jgi:hypothetical protein